MRVPTAEQLRRAEGQHSHSGTVWLEQPPALFVGLAPPSTFHLDPIGRIARSIRCINALAHDAFHAALLARGEQAKRIIIEGAGEQDGRMIVALDERLQLGAALHKRLVEQVLAVQVEQIEGPQT
jgi:hypothetical protein